jgi:hypothetical protein
VCRVRRLEPRLGRGELLLATGGGLGALVDAHARLPDLLLAELEARTLVRELGGEPLGARDGAFPLADCGLPRLERGVRLLEAVPVAGDGRDRLLVRCTVGGDPRLLLGELALAARDGVGARLQRRTEPARLRLLRAEPFASRLGVRMQPLGVDDPQLALGERGGLRSDLLLAPPELLLAFGRVGEAGVGVLGTAKQLRLARVRTRLGGRNRRFPLLELLAA